MIGVIKGTGSCVPGKVVTNDDIAGLVETSDGWIRERTGIEERHIATEETCVDLAAEAARRALQNAGMDAEELTVLEEIPSKSPISRSESPRPPAARACIWRKRPERRAAWTQET